MTQRLILAGLALFWVTMNILLWRAEYAAKSQPGSPVDWRMVWHKILTAPDNSTLEITQRSKKLGQCRWAPNVGQEIASGKTAREDYLPEGRVQKLTGYSLDLEGSLELTPELNRFRFHLNLQFSTNQEWKEFTLRAGQRPQFWDLRSSAAEQSLQVRIETEQGKWERTFSFSELSQPEKLLSEFGLQLLPGILPKFDLRSGAAPGRLGITWEARMEWLKMAHASTRVYRLQGRLLDRYQAVVLVSRAGEILRVELPNNIVLLNEALSRL